jgi:hypothetical protein
MALNRQRRRHCPVTGLSRPTAHPENGLCKVKGKVKGPCAETDSNRQRSNHAGMDVKPLFSLPVPFENSVRPCKHAPKLRLHSQYQISVQIDGKAKALNIPAELVEQVRQEIEMRRRFGAAAVTICKVNLKRLLKEKEDRQV